MQDSSGLLLPPDRILKPALPSGSLSYYRALIASSLVLNEVITCYYGSFLRIWLVVSGYPHFRSLFVFSHYMKMMWVPTGCNWDVTLGFILL